MTERKGFTNQLPWTVTPQDLERRWGGLPASERFRCFLCGHCFREGDTARWVYLNGTPSVPARVSCGNQFVCQDCDGPDVLGRIERHYADGVQRFWWLDRS